jgi:hypothetical protein
MQPISKQWFGKHVSVATGTNATMFCVWSLLICYKQDTLKQRAVVGWSCQQFSCMKWHEVAGWWVREFSWRSACEEETRRLVWNGCQPETQLVGLSVDKEFCKGGSERNTWVRKAEESPSVDAIGWKMLVETNRLRTLFCESVIHKVYFRVVYTSGQ